jgi:CelD/BcsL family acetyltransferase involved in cellulose biosynthesis
MKFSVISAGELDSKARGHWLELQRSNPQLASPYFCPEFTLAVADACEDVRIAVMEDDRGIAGFFPYQSRWSMGEPVGRLLSDHHGVVCAPETRWDWAALLRAARLSCWRFDHLCESQARGIRFQRAESPGADLSRGYAAYMAGRAAAHAEYVQGYRRKHRKLAREVGPLRFEAHVDDSDVMEAVVRWKSQQYRRAGVADIFRLRWTRRLLDRIRHFDHPHFAGRLSALYAGDKLVAAHLGMRSERVWHWWFPIYDNEYAKYSPGIHLLMHTASEAAAQGIGLLDFGKGGETYKAVFADTTRALAEGTFTRSVAASALFVAPYQASRWLLRTTVGQQLRPVVRRLRGL